MITHLRPRGAEYLVFGNIAHDITAFAQHQREGNNFAGGFYSGRGVGVPSIICANGRAGQGGAHLAIPAPAGLNRMARKPHTLRRIARALFWGANGGLAITHAVFTGPLVVGLAAQALGLA